MICPLGIREVAAFYRLGKGPLYNEAIVRESLGQPQVGSSLLGAYIRQWLPSRGKQRTWVYWDKGQVTGLISTRPRCGPRVSEINRLLLLTENKEACFVLLDRLKTMGSEQAISKIFLRLAGDSPYAEVPQTAGFSCYVTERLYQLKPSDNQRIGLPNSSFSSRRKKKADEYILFQLYNECVPAAVRQSEGLTLDEWQQCREKASGGAAEWLWMKDSSCVGWLRSGVSKGTGQLELMAHPEDESALENMLLFGLNHLRRCSTILCLSAEYQEKLQPLLRNYGFRQVAEYRLMLRLLAVPVAHPCIVPLRA